MIEKPIKEILGIMGITDFNSLLEFININSIQDIAFSIVRVLNFKKDISVQDKIKTYLSSNIGCFKSQFVGCATIYDAIVDIKENLEEYRWLNGVLSDEDSKITLFYILLYRLTTDKYFLKMCYNASMQYFDTSIFKPRDNEVFIDCGAYDGTTTIDFIHTYGKYNKIYVYEPAPNNFFNVKQKLKEYDNIEYLNKATSDQIGVCQFTSHMPDSANRINPLGDTIVEISTIDIDIKEPVTFIKMDIESAEPNALIGAKNHILNDKPNLAVSVYHTVSDLWTIPRIIYEINPNQSFYLRQHQEQIPEETVFYAAPVMTGESVLSIANRIDSIQELLTTINEGFNYTKQVLDEGNYEKATTMLADIKNALTSCGNSVDEILGNRD